MTILYLGGEDESVGVVSGVISTAAGRFRAGYARCALKPTDPELGIVHEFSGALATYIAGQMPTGCDFWYGFRYEGGGGFLNLSNNLVTFYSGGTPKFRIQQSGTDGCVAATWNGSGWNLVPGTGVTQPFTPTEYAFHFKCQVVGGKIEWWIGGVLWYTFVTSTADVITKAVWGNTNSNGDSYVSEIRATTGDDPCVGINVYTLPLTGLASHGDFIPSTVANINEITLDQGTLIASAVAGDEASYSTDALPVLGGSEQIRALAISCQARTAAGAPQNLEGLLVIGGVDYVSPSQAVSTVLSQREFIFQNSPASVAPFTRAEVNLAEKGFKTVA